MIGNNLQINNHMLTLSNLDCYCKYFNKKSTFELAVRNIMNDYLSVQVISASLEVYYLFNLRPSISFYLQSAHAIIVKKKSLKRD